MKHTPGPWFRADDRQVKRKDGTMIATAWWFGNKGSVPEAEAIANNYLIAAAPEMYEALRWLLHLCSGVSKGGDDMPITELEWYDAWGTAISAITKAEGGQ